MRQAFENLRDENDKPNEVKLSKLKTFPFFNKSDLSRFPKESERIVNQMRDNEAKFDDNRNENFSGINAHNQIEGNNDSLRQLNGSYNS